jgi:hypothetical protein
MVHAAALALRPIANAELAASALAVPGVRDVLQLHFAVVRVSAVGLVLVVLPATVRALVAAVLAALALVLVCEPKRQFSHPFSVLFYEESSLQGCNPGRGERRLHPRERLFCLL